MEMKEVIIVIEVGGYVEGGPRYDSWVEGGGCGDVRGDDVWDGGDGGHNG